CEKDAEKKEREKAVWPFRVQVRSPFTGQARIRASHDIGRRAFTSVKGSPKHTPLCHRNSVTTNLPYHPVSARRTISTSCAICASSVISSSILRTACITVV